jgi:hypothetical protein
MWMFDFLIFYQAGKAVLMGQSPAAIPGFISPYPLAVLFAPFALLPEPLAYALFIALNLFFLWKVMGKRMIWALLSFPVLFTLFVGQIDLLLALAIPLGTPFTLALAMVKPQVAIVILPWLLRRLDKNGWLKAIAVGLAFLGLCFILRPVWVTEWLSGQPNMDVYSSHASNFFWLIPDQGNLRNLLSAGLVVLALVPAFLLRERRLSWSALQFFQPLTNIYSVSVLAEWFGPLEMALSWAAVFVVGGNIHNGMPMLVIPLSLAAGHWWRKRQRKSNPPAPVNS